ncbi:DUF3862 domain-containing protein [Clostridium sp. Marseille-Q2269]|uniref:DUF3862 domain-containing protein n=1 Tax=Clostridium sp. Marseille-Q2269 TaxID=2942205 RepID=UPI00207388A6|nr:DUF3862 domain-containing protein [Clostridium sp. Marseille-Q2269]
MTGKIKEPFYKKNWFWVIIIIIICGVAGYGGNKNISIPSIKSSITTEVKKDDNRKVTYDKFSKIKIGSTYEEVKNILGEGKESKSSEVGKIKEVIYTWYNEDGSNMNITIKNNKVIGKGQAGLSSKKAEVNMIKYTKIKKGMDYNKVKEILDDGQLISISEVNGITRSVYLWINPDGTNMNVTFENGKSIARTQLGLK